MRADTKQPALTVFLIWACLLAALGACSSKQPAAEEDGYTVSTIAVMPVQPANDRAAVGTDAMTGLLAEYFEGKDGIALLHGDMVDAMAIDHAQSPGERALNVARALNKDAVLVLRLGRYRKRTGDKYSVDAPASVAFDYRLLHAASGATLCAGRFDETQESFSANILSLATMFKRGFKWITSRQLAKEGLQKTLGECRYLKQ